MKTYVVRLNLPCVMWALVEVQATSQSQAEDRALSEARAGNVSFESSEFDVQDAEVTDVEEQNEIEAMEQDVPEDEDVDADRITDFE